MLGVGALLMGCGPGTTVGEVRMAERLGSITYELRSVVVLQGRTCTAVTGYFAIAGDEDPADTVCAVEDDVLAVHAERDGLRLTAWLDVQSEPWVGQELVLEALPDSAPPEG